ncbi:truC [Symbiodinium natans]|uniref:TruC protein n=1 Tax=Symbiodinium natans TaxID=878477 RepID=A0A812LUU6_9DINO|nr:truC [Symbiodinium natans]
MQDGDNDLLQWDVALSLLQQLGEASLRTNTICFGAAASACVRRGSWQAGLNILDWMLCENASPDTTSCSSLISACDNSGEWALAWCLLARMCANGSRRDVIAYNAAVSACEKSLQWTRAVELVACMGSDGVQASSSTFNAVLNALHASWASQLGISSGMAKPTWAQAVTVLQNMHWERLLLNGVHAGLCIDIAQKEFDMITARALGRKFLLDWGQGAAQAASAHLPRDDVILSAPGVVAVSKPPGVASQDLLAELEELSMQKLTTVSRLDLPTSGVLVAAVGDEQSAAAKWLQAQYSGRLVSKEYLCLCHTQLAPPAPEFEVSTPLRVVTMGPMDDEKTRAFVDAGGREAYTRCEAIAVQELPASAGESRLALLRVFPRTGRTHQIRAHLASIGLPLFGDTIYGKFITQDLANLVPDLRDYADRLFLHCRQQKLLALDGEQLILEAPMPEDLKAILRILEPEVDWRGWGVEGAELIPRRYYPIEEKAEDSATGVDIHEDDRARLEEGAAIAAARQEELHAQGVVMAVPPPPTGEFTGFSYAAASFAAGQTLKPDTNSNSWKANMPCAGQNAIVTRSSGEESGCYILEVFLTALGPLYTVYLGQAEDGTYITKNCQEADLRPYPAS